MTTPTPTAMNAASPDFPDECAATGQTCAYGPHGRNGERQCKWCGATPAGQGGATSGEAATLTVEELLGQYWDLAYNEGASGNHDGNKANAVLSALRTALAAKAEQSGQIALLERQLKAARTVSDEHFNTILELRAERAVTPASVPKPAAMEVAEQALQALRHMQGLAAMPDGRNPRDVLRTYIQLTSAAAPEVAQPAAQGERTAPSNLSGWEIKRGHEGQIIVRQVIPDYAGYVASRDSDNIASSVLYELANTILATPAPTAGEPSATKGGAA